MRTMRTQDHGSRGTRHKRGTNSHNKPPQPTFDAINEELAAWLGGLSPEDFEDLQSIIDEPYSDSTGVLAVLPPRDVEQAHQIHSPESVSPFANPNLANEILGYEKHCGKKALAMLATLDPEKDPSQDRDYVDGFHFKTRP